MDEEDLLLKQEVILVEKKDEYFKSKRTRQFICNFCLFSVILVFLIFISAAVF
jgi:hypothetical protein